MRVGEQHDAAAELAGARDRDAHRFLTEDGAVTAIAVERDEARGVERHARVLVDAKAPEERGIDVAGDHAHAVRVMPAQVRLDERCGDRRRFMLVAAGGAKHRGDGARQRRRGEDVFGRHRSR